ncbi:aldehyde dehydrogenase family protein [Flavobacteriaceae bacterium R38]|nr:aldehyde dehydrogenase family protein [Flavobacteriaceae bacterium R38]
MTFDIKSLIQQHHTFFKSEKTKDVIYRREALIRLKKEILLHEDAICNAIYKDFGKSPYESLLTETQMVLAEINTAIRKIKYWAKPKRTFPSLSNFPSTDKVYSEPYGTVLIIAPWNYPFQLAIMPLIGAIAAGNTVVLKPSELTNHTSKIILKIIESVFEKSHVTAIEGDVEITQALLKEKWDYIFFTGSIPVGKIVYKAAAEHLTPVTLELGGKNPCIIDETVNIRLAAKRIVWGKFLNAGQTCNAPDYILIHPKIKSEFYNAIKEEIVKAYGNDPEKSEDFPNIINERHFNRLKTMLDDQHIVIGGKTNKDNCYISPTIIDEPSLDSEVMKGEIFGPILPVISYKDEVHIDTIIAKYGKPLSLYIFSKNRKRAKRIIKKYAFGGGAINDTVVQIVNKRLPFGGVGDSGIGAYHGKLSFDVFSHKKAIVKRGTWLDVPVRYAPYGKKINLAKKIKHLF